MTPRHTLLAIALAASSSAQAFSCAPTGNAECRLELSTITIVFDAGIYNFDGDSQFNGSDGYVQGYTVGAGQFPDLTPIDTHGGLHVGFSFAPGMVGVVGGSGFNGTHEAFASFSFNGLQFIAKPGFQVDAVAFSVHGGLTQVGNGHVGLLIPGVPQFVGDQFTARDLYAPGTPQFIAAFSASASYQEGEDGTAVSYGTASAFFDSASIIAQVRAIPLSEPAGWSIWLLGGEPVVVTFCPLCGTGVAFDARVAGRELSFGVSGLLYNSDVLLYDRQTNSLLVATVGPGHQRSAQGAAPDHAAADPHHLGRLAQGATGDAGAVDQYR